MTDFVGSSKVITELRTMAERVADSDALVLISGETGTGKDVLAEYIREHSSRKDCAHVVVNCGAIPVHLAENEFFGHVRGAFTDAVADYAGAVARADKGVLFLDEIADLDPVLQAKLLRFIQYKVYQPIGAAAEYTADVRIIAATNKDLKALVKAGVFREDLYYRLNVVPLELPPLRERASDVEELALFFLKKYTTVHHKRGVLFKKGVLALLSTYGWPGNVRELENIIERAVVLCRSNLIEETDIVFEKSFYEKYVDDEVVSLKKAMDNFKKSYIIKALNECGWNQTKTAKKLEIQRTYLARLIRELEINKF